MRWSEAVFAVGLAATAALLAAPAAAQNAAQGSAPSQPEAAAGVDEVVVRGKRMSELEFNLRDYIGEFVNEVAAPPAGRGFARWQRGVCVGVVNLEHTAAQYIADRVSRLALDVGLEPGEPGCQPDVVVVFTTDAGHAAASMVESEPRLFRPGMGHSSTNLGRKALDDFVQSDKAVRWWHVSMPVDARTGQRAIRMAGDDSPPVVNVAGPSRIHSGIRDDLMLAMIIVDATKLTGTTWQQLGDYLAVVALAQIDPQADLANFDSILNLFSNPLAYSGLTDWDVSYMRALYAFDQERIPRMQAIDLTSKMLGREREREE